MAEVVANLPAELAEVTEGLRPGDELLTGAELGTISLFESLKKTPPFDKFPGSTILRSCSHGRVMCSQGEAGATAFYILTSQDVLELKENQRQAVHAELQRRRDGLEGDDHRPALASLSEVELRRREAALSEEIERLRGRLAEFQAGDEATADSLRQVATANLLVNLDRDQPRRGLLHRLVRAFQGRSSNGETNGAGRPVSIPIDGPADIDAGTLSAPLREGELFGEMSCMNRSPRSATVIGVRDGYMLEMLRNVLDMVHRDPEQQKALDATYRRRVLEGHVRRLSIFQELTDAEFARLKDRIELVDFPSGSVLFEEHEASDSFYVIRSGLVKVVKNAWCLVRHAEFDDSQWSQLCRELGAASAEDAAELQRTLWQALSSDVRETVLSLHQDRSATASEKEAILDGLNEFIKTGLLHTKLGKTKAEVVAAVESPDLRAASFEFPENPKNWSELEARTFHRLLLEQLCPAGMPRRLATCGPRRTLAYLGRGEILGETGTLLGELRNATCVAYDHPDSGTHQRIPDSRTGAVPSRVELLRIGKQEFQQLVAASPRLKSRVQQIVDQRRKSAASNGEAQTGRTPAAVQSPEFEQLGLIQGQKLMLIDLERCTRCGACVDACVQAHDDGRTRLYLDGPRFEKYLVPLTCRKCLDPVCMIGCPVGAINRGDNGEIRITDWCIGCSLCADQCPYGSIQMNAVARPAESNPANRLLLEPGATLKSVTEQAVVCDLCSSLPSRDPACVYACPHDAAFRVNAQEFFFEPSHE